MQILTSGLKANRSPLLKKERRLVSGRSIALNTVVHVSFVLNTLFATFFHVSRPNQPSNFIFSQNLSFSSSKTIKQYVCFELDGSIGEEHEEEVGDAYDSLMEEDDEFSDSDEDETESSVDLLIRFLHSLFKKISKRAKKASRSFLPSVISPQLVSFPLIIVYTSVFLVA
ncbi:uncharacterized protein LOC120000660 [Tripterygium wilfordii]|uniref:uncharacterized protein LOC120000660 n=1 Tax=Tripterygium wilfordii TaxID=458696 RepID=UPI0018F85CD9|nr:uncharacterized protein LOC120000660 [Tripterygium wilfordii]